MFPITPKSRLGIQKGLNRGQGAKEYSKSGYFSIFALLITSGGILKNPERNDSLLPERLIAAPLTEVNWAEGYCSVR